MNIIQRIIHRFGESRSVQSVAARLWPWIGSGVLGPVTDSGMTVTPLTAMQSATVLACVRLISESIAALPLHVYHEVDNVRQRETSHPVQRLIYNSPNPDQTSFVFRDFMLSNLLLYGQSIAIIDRDPMTGYASAIWPQQAGDIFPYRTAAGMVVYVHKSGIICRPDQVLHLVGFTRDGLNGLGPIQLAAASIGLDLSMTRFGSRFFKGGFLAGVLEREGNLSAEAAKEFARQWREQFEGLDNSHGTPLLPVGVKYKPLTLSPEASQFLESRRYSREEICSLFKVHPSMIGDTSKSSYNTLEMTNLSFVQTTLMPWLRRIEEEFSRKLFLTSEQVDYSIRFNIDGLLRADTGARQSYYASGRQWGYLCVNDIRALENLPPIDGGDVYLSPVNMQPVGASSAVPAPAAAQVVEDAARRLLTKEAKAVQRAVKKLAGKPDELRKWADQWYTNHEQLVTRSLAPALQAAGIATAPAELAKRHCDTSKSQIMSSVSGCDPIDLNDVLDDWETTRPHDEAVEWLQKPWSC